MALIPETDPRHPKEQARREVRALLSPIIAYHQTGVAGPSDALADEAESAADKLRDLVWAAHQCPVYGADRERCDQCGGKA